MQDARPQELATPTPTRRWARWLIAIGFALIPTIFTSVGSATGVILGLDDPTAMLVIAAAALVSFAIGLAVRAIWHRQFVALGWGAPVRARAVWWWVPLIAAVVIVAVTGGFGGPPAVIGAGIALAVAVALNEELWFRGLILRVLHSIGSRTAIIGSSVLFGILHAATALGGASGIYVVLQILFAALFGLVAALLVVHTKSLWPGVAWHAAHDAVSFAGGDALSASSTIGLGIVCVLLAGYAVVLWRRMDS